MSISFLDVFDQLRFMIGAIACEWIFVINAVPKRANFKWRAFIGLGICVVFSLSYFPSISLFIDFQVLKAIVIGIWWFLASFVSIGFFKFCFHISVCNVLFRGILGLMLQQVITVLLRYCLVGLMYPEFPDNHPIAYISVVIIVYSIVCISVYHCVAKKMRRKNVIVDNRNMLWAYILIITIFSIFADLTSGIFTWLLDPDLIVGTPEMLQKILLPLYCIAVLLMLCAITFVILFIVHEVADLQQENELLERLRIEKEKQYEYSKENIDLINQKCHDLKHQIHALRIVDESERAQLIEETAMAVQFYDANVETDNEVLDIILTEKSLVCTNHKIRLSCNINATRLDCIAVVDLYTMLGNALDNAIECVAQYEELDKRIISLSIHEKGQMLNIFVDNYFEGELRMKNGYPITSKENKAYHGYGIKSIRMLAEKYNGDIRISHQNRTFSLHILIPIMEKG